MQGALVASRVGFRNKERLRRILKNLPEAQRTHIRQALVDGGNQIAATMRQLVPVGQGADRAPAPYLRDSIKSELGGARRGRTSTQDPQLTVVISAGNPVTGKTNRSDASLVEHGTSSMARRPFFFPAFRAHRKEVASKVRRAVKRAIKDALLGRGVSVK